MKFKLVALHKLNEGFYSVPQAVKDSPNEDIAESNRRFYIEQNMKSKSSLMPVEFADNMDLVVIGEFEDTTGTITNYDEDKKEVLGNLGTWLREAGLYGKETFN